MNSHYLLTLFVIVVPGICAMVISSLKQIDNAVRAVLVWICQYAGVVGLGVVYLFSETHYQISNMLVITGINFYILCITAYQVIKFFNERVFLSTLYFFASMSAVIVSFANLNRGFSEIYSKGFSQGPLSGVEALYYTISTFTGFGTLDPVDYHTQILISVEMIASYITGTVLIALLVTVVVDHFTKKDDPLDILSKAIGQYSRKRTENETDRTE
ncbi:hypothetical protein [Alicyclobacillus acidoterrestris]|uniref:Uncharacterized protein n=1 Tax=Alicyclobacillus acidoterrestris (strain ATCC 49025 / DSM 3922 / CIP 106132 / NCIMB 13137 / GD3B) TaxID=1356854 RepID=T0CAD5_ALIAG|nr:hypothetical protein [Alicyclobacillus acidoterrestris]EPZ53073.1 hypothetical protein N007_18260 [Alicyclobacillus acidoterrestris ATCC 49025]UNO49389.1 hypothetical protein K1I37_02190 [Alicyclobacillus acidoterrestris]